MARPEKLSAGSEPREASRQQVVSVIRSAGQIARIDIAQETGVSPATVTAITAELIQAGLIEEVSPDAAPATPGRGRPRVSLRVRGAAHILAGIKVSASTISTILIDFDGTTLSEHKAPLPEAQMPPEVLVQRIVDTLGAAAAETGRRIGDLSGLGVGLSGVIDVPEGLVHWSPSMTRRNVALRDLLEAALPMPVFLDNDANLVAKAEQLFGEGRGVRDFLVVTIEHGVGMGIIIDGQIYRGTRGCGAEFGHTKVHLGGALCRCGQRGCLEAYVADYALLREATGTLPELTGTTPEEKLDRLFAAARAGDGTAKSILERASRMFAMGLANLVNIFDPALIIVSGERMSHDFLYSDEVIAMVRTQVMQVDAAPPEVRIHKWGDMMWAKGAAAYAMEGVTGLAVRKMTDA
ncbi:MAG: ROK family transcriptional regulator [Maritimibacter sp.]|nr:ROK family transcriptional regulator [Maritimibacter sp.]